MAVDVNKVYRAVLSILNKESRGFLTPDQFNKIGRQVQLDIFEKTFYDYNRALNKKKSNVINTEYADIPKNIKEKIDIFSKESEITITENGAIKSGVNVRERTSIVGVSIPTQVTAGTYSNLATTTNGSGTGLTVTIVAATNSFTTITTVANGSGYVVGDIITIPQASMTGANGNYTFPIESTDIIDGNLLLPSDLYRIINLSIQNRSINLEEVNKSEYTYVNSSKLTTPSETYPIYYRGYNGIKISPISLATQSLTFDYIKEPADPIWAYTSGVNSSYSFNSGASTDFELHESDEVNLVIKILAYTGVLIKDPAIVQAASQEENKIIQLENQ